MEYTKKDLKDMRFQVSFQNSEGFNVYTQRELVNQCLELMEKQDDFSEIPQDVKDAVFALKKNHNSGYLVLSMLFRDGLSEHRLVIQDYATKCETVEKLDNFVLFILKA